ncbi:type III secretion apparatus assembly protein SctX [Algicola sagamiensis]|uniref:type III secretion apparatus assembly protein SctX n=1 Tax=Algicola sagamiensis TaxID=163869 RepID=UPI00036F13AE|nr:hypothetical protein [Algicola sagamiensis]
MSDIRIAPQTSRGIQYTETDGMPSLYPEEKSFEPSGEAVSNHLADLFPLNPQDQELMKSLVPTLASLRQATPSNFHQSMVATLEWLDEGKSQALDENQKTLFEKARGLVEDLQQNQHILHSYRQLLVKG